MDKKLIVARYADERYDENEKPMQRLIIIGPFSENVINGFFLSHNPYTHCSEENGPYGEVSFEVEFEKECSELVNKLNTELEEKRYNDCNLEYRGPVAVPPEKLINLKEPYDLYRLVINTMIAESKEEIKQEELKQLDYQKTLEKLTE